MKVLLIYYMSNFFLTAKCGLVKDFFGTVSDEVHKLAKGNVVVNTVHEIVEVKKEIITDFSNIINPNNYLKLNNNHKNLNTDTANQFKLHNTDNNDLLSISKPTVNINEVTPTVGNNPILSNDSVSENTIINANKEKEKFTQTSTEFIKPIVFDQNSGDADITEFGIEPRNARDISPFENEQTKEKNVTAGTNMNKETDFDIEENGLKNEMKANETLNSLTDAYASITINFDTPLNNNGVIETVVVDGCPEGFEVAPNGSCDLPFDAGNDTRQEGKNRANFFGGCFQGFAHAEDGTCQEVIYD